MDSMKAGPTRTRAAALREQRTTADRLRTWREKRAEKRRKDKAAKKAGSPRQPGNGITLDMRAIKRPEPTYLVEHTGPTYAERRRYHLNTGRSMPRSTNAPYANLERDLKRHARLRVELRAETVSS